MAISSEPDNRNADMELELNTTLPKKARPITAVYRFPWWALILLITGVLIVIATTANEDYAKVFAFLSKGIVLTLRMSFFGYTAAMIIGLLVGLVRSTPPLPGSDGRPTLTSFLRLILYNICTLYVEVMRGLPIAIVILVSAFVIGPEITKPLNNLLGTNIRSASEFTVTIGLSLAYGAFLSEVFRAGIQSVEKGQREAARALGLTFIQSMRFIVLPQAIRRVLPTLGNDFIAMIKDSSLAALVGVQEITQLSKTYSSSNFKFLETYLVGSLMYLTMTILGSILVQLMERYLKTHER
jgi:polar amino acid transport system permease protein